MAGPSGAQSRDLAVALANIDKMLLDSGNNAAGIVNTSFFGHFCDVIEHRCDTEKVHNFRKVVDNNPEWLYPIVDVALKLVDISKNSQNSDERLPGDPFILVATICSGIQETAQALSNLKVQRWPDPDVGKFSHLRDDAASRNNLIQAICQGVGAWTPSGALMVGLHMTLYIMGVTAELDTPTGNAEVSSEEGAVPEATRQQLGMVCDLAKMHRTVEAGAGAKFAGAGANFKLKFTENPWFMGVLEKMGLKLLREFFEKRGDNLRSMTVANRAGCPSRDIVMDSRRFMSSNTGMCAVWFKQSRTLETYQRMQLTKCHGVLELLCTFKDVGKLPTWDDTLVQEFTIRNGRLSSLSQDCEGYELPKRTSGKDMYEPVKLCCEGAEKYVEEALVSSNLKGGCWNTIMYGRPPTTCPDNETGFRTAPLCVAVAGMAIWFPSNHRKMAAWMDFPNVKLCDDRSLTLGTCNVNAGAGGRPGKEEQVAFVAHENSKIWKTKVMFG